MAQTNITVTFTDDSVVKLPILPIHRVAFERHFGVPFGSLQDEPFEERLLWLGWHSAVKGRPNPPTFDEWLETVAALGGGDTEEEADPLGKTAPSGESLPSPSSPVPASPSID